MERLRLQKRYRIYENDEEALKYFIHLFLHEWDQKDLFAEAYRFGMGEIDTLETAEIQPQEQKTDMILRNLINGILLHLPKTRKYERAIDIFYVPNYQDKFFADIYAAYYSEKHFSPEKSSCSRFFLFDANRLEGSDTIQEIKEAFIGTIVRRPLSGREIGRTLINPRFLFEEPYKESARGNIWQNKYNVTMYGIPLTVSAFPYTMQDGEVATCAETSIINLLDYYSARYPDYKIVTPSKISEIVRRYGNTRNLPSPGLTYEMISKVLLETGFSPKLYTVKDFNNQLVKILHTYIASGIPVAVGLEGGSSGDNARHSIIIIGTPKKMIYASAEERKRDFERSSLLLLPDAEKKSCYAIIQKTSIQKQYVVMDDRKAPYTVATVHDDINSLFLTYDDASAEHWDISIFAVPLSREMMMDADTAISCFENLLKSTMYSYIEYIHTCQLKRSDKKALLAGDYNQDEKPLMMRIFLCSSRRLKEQRIQKYKDKGNWEVMVQFQEVHLPHFVWVCELYTYDSYIAKPPYCVGEMILDATTGAAHDDDSTVVWIQYPGLTVFRHQNERITELRERMGKAITNEIKGLDWQPIDPFQFEDIK